MLSPNLQVVSDIKDLGLKRGFSICQKMLLSYMNVSMPLEIYSLWVAKFIITKIIIHPNWSVSLVDRINIE